MLRQIAFTAATTFLILAGVAVSSTAGQAQSTPVAPANQKAPTAECLVGYPDGTYKSDRALTRYELAAGMNACLNKLNESVPKSGDFAIKSEFDIILQQQRTMNEELRKLNDQVNTLPVE